MVNNQRKQKYIKIILIISICLNIIFGFDFLFRILNLPQDRIGILTKDAFVGAFMDTTVIFKLPKGLTVRDASPKFLAAAGQFEPNRFSIVFTSKNATVVDYNVKKDSLNQFGEMYSLKVKE